MNEQMMELVDRMLLLTEENAKMRECINHLMRVVIKTEIKDAKACAEYGYSYSPSLKCDNINMIMGWKRNEEAERIMKKGREEAKDEPTA